MKIFRIPVLSDNYVFLIHDDDLNQSIVVDPAVADPVRTLLYDLGAELVGIWNTHHHHDHVGGNRSLLKDFPNAEVIAGVYDSQNARIPGQTKVVKGGDRLTFANRTVEVIDCPGHTLGHIAYYFPPHADERSHLFCGDTLFAGGCGRLFEGSPAQMLQSLNEFGQLPRTTQVWCAHEYTLSNLQFALTQDEDNEALQQRFDQVQIARKNQEPTVPTTIEIERATNPFLKCGDAHFQSKHGLESDLDLFTMIRKRKDKF